MNLFEKYLDESIEEFNAEGVKVKIIGQKERLSESLQNVIVKVEEATEKNNTINKRITRAKHIVIISKLPVFHLAFSSKCFKITSAQYLRSASSSNAKLQQ